MGREPWDGAESAISAYRCRGARGWSAPAFHLLVGLVRWGRGFVVRRHVSIDERVALQPIALNEIQSFGTHADSRFPVFHVVHLPSFVDFLS